MCCVGDCWVMFCWVCYGVFVCRVMLMMIVVGLFGNVVIEKFILCFSLIV